MSKKCISGAFVSYTGDQEIEEFAQMQNLQTTLSFLIMQEIQM